VWICVMLLIESAAFMRRGATLRASSMDFPMAYVYVVVPLGLGALVLVGLEHVLRLARASGDESQGPLLLSGVVPVVQMDPSELTTERAAPDAGTQTGGAQNASADARRPSHDRSPRVD
jgi:hypothetical protein